jgi:macrolide-specific efflux system membrane fusion protein
MTAAIAEADIADVKVGQAVAITFPALTDVTATAKVTAIAPTATTSNSVVTYATTITLDKIPTGLRLGQTADATITTTTSGTDALYVPTAAITTATDGTSTVKVVANGKTISKTVTLGVVGDDGTEIKSGLTEGQTVVLGTVAATTSTTTTTGTTGRTGTTGGFGGGTGTGGFGGGTGTGGGFGGNR